MGYNHKIMPLDALLAALLPSEVDSFHSLEAYSGTGKLGNKPFALRANDLT
jgi:hypothetical protein